VGIPSSGNNRNGFNMNKEKQKLNDNSLLFHETIGLHKNKKLVSSFFLCTFADGKKTHRE